MRITIWMIWGICCCLWMLGCGEKTNPSSSFKIPTVWDDSLEKKFTFIPIDGTQETIVNIKDAKGNPWGYFVMRDSVADGQGKLFYSNGNVYREANFNHGVLHGEMRTYWLNGNLRWIHPMKEGVLEGIQCYFDSLGRKITVIMFANGLREGLGEWYYPDSLIKQQGMYHVGYPVGKHFVYDSLGRLMQFRYFGRYCMNPPCDLFGITFNSSGMPIDSFSRGPSEAQEKFYDIIRRDTFQPTYYDSSLHLEYLLRRNNE
jgi:MORN repeat variant